MERYICIHGHFYQPPRENPWLEAVEVQDSAFPYHDWNERITAECYAPNSAARVVDDHNRILDIQSNYERMSFNFGPTLLSWMQESTPDIHGSIQQADAESCERFSGHGNALAQVFNHMIMPLASARDKRTQVIWGVRDFEKRFGRRPEGMWLAECAADLASLEALAEEGITFTVLAPHQASRVKKLGASAAHWRDVGGGRIDPTRAYLQSLPSGREMVLFFYDGPISRAVAFEGLLSSGERFADRLMSGFSEKRTWPQLMHIATDGETYGHHHKFGEMALAHALRHIETAKLAKLTNYGEFLEQHPPDMQVEIVEGTSWSCAHGIERWRSNCGCCSAARPGWTQQWRGPLRAALDWLRDEIAVPFEQKGRELLIDPWGARDQYIDVLLDRSNENVDRFLARVAVRPLNDSQSIAALKLMEMQRHAMLMYTSCGWFFDELSGLETMQVMQYAGRCAQLAEDVLGLRVEEEFARRLAKATSNIPEQANGGEIYRKRLKPGQLDLSKVAAHYAISAMFPKEERAGRLYAYTVETEESLLYEAGAARLHVGRVRVASEVTREQAPLTFGVIHFGDHHLNGAVREFQGDYGFNLMAKDISDAFSHADFAETIRRLDKHFAGTTYSLKSLFKDEQRRILGSIVDKTLEQATANLRLIFESHAALMGFLKDVGMPQPRVLISASQFVLSADLRDIVEDDFRDEPRLNAILRDARMWELDLKVDGLDYLVKKVITDQAIALSEDPFNTEEVRSLTRMVRLARRLPIELMIWRAQNIYHELLDSVFAGEDKKARTGDRQAAEWIRAFAELGEQMMVAVPEGSGTESA